MTPNSRVQHGELLIVYNLWLFMGSNLVTDCSILRLQLMSTKTLVTKQNKGNSAFLVGFVFFVLCYTSLLPALCQGCTFLSFILFVHGIIDLSQNSEELDIMTRKNKIFSYMANIPITITDYPTVSVHPQKDSF